jgi:hypothetical protein
MNTKTLYLLFVVLVCAGCSTTRHPDVTGGGSQLETRQIQTREYTTLDRRLTLRSVVATLQDLGFIIDRAVLEVGTVTATRHSEYTMRITVTVRDKGNSVVAVRANARIDERHVDDARTYQDFFTALDKAIFLTAQRVD